MYELRHIALILMTALSLAALAQPVKPAPGAGQSETRSRIHQAVTGPRTTMNQAIAAGATATITLQPVQPKTVPPSNYPPGTTITGSTIKLGSVPARVWFESHITGWAPEVLRTVQISLDATDADGDGGGYYGDNADCNGAPVTGAGDLFPAIVPCNGAGFCRDDPMVSCLSDSDCGLSDLCFYTDGHCQGNPMVHCRSEANCTAAGTTGPCHIDAVCAGNLAITCQSSSDCTAAGTTGPCLPEGRAICRAAISGLTSNSPCGDLSRCVGRPPYFPPGSGFVCQYGFIDYCDPQWAGTGWATIALFDVTTVQPRWGATMNEQYGIGFEDFEPSYAATMVLDVPADAKGRYVLDYLLSGTFVLNGNAAPNNQIPIAALNPGVIQVPCGRCCFGYASGQIECVESVGQAQCADANDQVFTDGEVCPSAGGPDCPECASNNDCDDGIACTMNLCGADHACTYAPSSALCDDGLFCNGPEICDVSAGGCISGPGPCDANPCDEDADECRAGIPTVSNWGMVMMACLLLIAAKLHYRRMAAPNRDPG